MNICFQNAPLDRIPIVPITVAIARYAEKAREYTTDAPYSNAVGHLICHLHQTPAPANNGVVQERTQAYVGYGSRSDFRRLMVPEIGVMEYPQISRFVYAPTSREQL